MKSVFVKTIILAVVFSAASQAQAKLRVVASTTDLRSVIEIVGGDRVDVDSIAKGTQDQHTIEPKPSYMVKASHADLFVAVGLELEIGWVPSVLQGARNPKIMHGEKGYLEVGPFIDRLEMPTGSVTRAEGDVHPFGNPHIMLDPVRVGIIAEKIAEKLSELDPPGHDAYTKRAQDWSAHLNARVKEWQKEIEASHVTKVVTYHRTLDYFLDRFHIALVEELEPKPGIPPTVQHMVTVVDKIRSEHVPLVMIENYYDPSVSRKLTEEVKDLKIEVVPVSVEGAPGITNLEKLYEALVNAVVKAKK